MDPLNVFPDADIRSAGVISKQFIELDIPSFRSACEWVHQLAYGYNADRDDLMSLFQDGYGTCTTKHAVIATLAAELSLPIQKHIGIYAMTDILVTGTHKILKKYELPYIPMVHCFLAYDQYRVDLTEGNANGKNGTIEEFLYSTATDPAISAKDEYLLYRKTLKEHLLQRGELNGRSIKTILNAREEGLALLMANSGS